MSKNLRRIVIIVAIVLVLLFVAFLYFIPPLTMIPQKDFIDPYASAVRASINDIADPAERLIAERGRYIVSFSGCNDCHTPQGDQGPDFEVFLSGGGMRMSMKGSGTAIAGNLTPDPHSGLGRRSDEEVLRVLEKGVASDGRIMNPTFMPWGAFSHWTSEDRHAVLIYLRHLRPVYHEIPGWSARDDGTKFEISAGNFGTSTRGQAK